MNLILDMPQALSIPVSTAANIRFTDTHTGAKDIAFAVTVAWLAANRPDIAVPVPENP